MITTKFSLSTKGFYKSDIKYNSIPKDATDINSSVESDLKNAISNGIPIAQKTNGDFSIATSDCCTWNVSTQSWDFDEVLYVNEKKAILTRSLASYRWGLFNDKIYVGSQLINVDTDGRQELSFNTQSFSAMPVEERPSSVDFKELDDAGWISVNPTDAINWQIMISMSDSKESRTAQKAVETLVDALSTKIDVDSFDAESELDEILKPVLSSDLTKYAYPVKYWNEDNL